MRLEWSDAVFVIAALSAACGSSSPRDVSPAPGHTDPSPIRVPATEAVPHGDAAAAAKLVGRTPPEWQTTLWLNSPPLRLADLRGKVVLVRWWTAGCPFCSASAPALREFDHDYRSRGLVVVGMYHHKEDGPFDPAVYEKTGKQYGFAFPLAFDPDWRTLKSWMGDVDTGFTSVSFVVGKTGVVEYVHPGGQYVKGDAGYSELRAAVEKALSEG
jgi:peroxiredoxin